MTGVQKLYKDKEKTTFNVFHTCLFSCHMKADMTTLCLIQKHVYTPARPVLWVIEGNTRGGTGFHGDGIHGLQQ